MGLKIILNMPSAVTAMSVHYGRSVASVLILHDRHVGRKPHLVIAQPFEHIDRPPLVLIKGVGYFPCGVPSHRPAYGNTGNDTYKQSRPHRPLAEYPVRIIPSRQIGAHLTYHQVFDAVQQSPVILHALHRHLIMNQRGDILCRNVS